MLLSRLSTCYGTISRDTVQLEDLLGHGCESMFARGGGRMVSIVTMCHVRRTQMLCCWQQHAPSGNCQHCQQTRKTHILCLKGCWMICIDLFVVAVWVFTVSQTDKHTIWQYAHVSCLSVLFVHFDRLELATTWSTAQSRPWYESACPSAWNARSKTCGLFRAVGQLHATTPKSSAKLHNSHCETQHVEGQAVPVLRASFQPAGAGYLLHSGWWRGCTHIADLPTATGRQLPGGWSSTNQRQTLQETQKVGRGNTIEEITLWTLC